MSSRIVDRSESSDTRAELRGVAEALSQIRFSRSESTKARIYVEIGGTTGSTTPVEIAVSPKALDRITRLIEKAGSEVSKSGRLSRAELSTQEAADKLGVSRPYLVKLLDTGKIPHRRVGRYRRVLREDLERFERNDQKTRRAGLEELAAFTQEIGLEY